VRLLPLVQTQWGFCVSFASPADAGSTCAHVRLLGPCYKTGRNRSTDTELELARHPRGDGPLLVSASPCGHLAGFCTGSETADPQKHDSPTYDHAMRRPPEGGRWMHARRQASALRGPAVPDPAVPY